MFLVLPIKLVQEKQEVVQMVFYIYPNFEPIISKGLLRYPLQYGMSCRSPSESVTRLVLLKRHIYNITINDLYSYYCDMYISFVYIRM
jgi:hypothetical protein